MSRSLNSKSPLPESARFLLESVGEPGCLLPIQLSEHRQQFLSQSSSRPQEHEPPADGQLTALCLVLSWCWKSKKDSLIPGELPVYLTIINVHTFKDSRESTYGN